MRFADVVKGYGIVEADAEVLTYHLILDSQISYEVVMSYDMRFYERTT